MWWVGLAWAQDGVPDPGDLHGPLVPVVDGSPSTPLFVRTPPRGPAGAFAASVTAETFRGTAYASFEGDAAPTALLRGGTLVGLAARGAVSRRLELAAAFSSAPVLGVGARAVTGTQVSTAIDRAQAFTDLLVSAPIGLVVPAADGGARGPWLGVTPEATLPTGTAARYLGERRPTAGLAFTAGAAGDHDLFAVDAGVRTQPQLLGGVDRGWLRLQGGVAAGVRPVGTWWLRAEARGWSSFADTVGTGAEWFATSSVGLGPVRWSLGGGRGFVGGLGAADLRVVSSLALVRAGTARPDRPPPPDTPGYRFEVRASDGRPVVGAEVVVAGEVVGRTGIDGSLLLEAEPRWSQVVVRAPGYVETGVGRSPEGTVAVEMPYAPSRLPLQVTDPEGHPVAVVATLTDERGAERVVRDGELLDPGRYELVLTAPGFGRQERVVEVIARAPVDPVDAVLLPEAGRSSVSLRLVDPTGAPVDGARVLIDGVPVGTTDDGVLTLAALSAGPHTVEVLHDGFTTTTASGVQLADDALLELPLTLQRVPGTVRVRVRDGSGHPVDDAIVRFIGPRRLPPMQLGVQGERTEVLGAGAWTVTVTSPQYGLQEREIDVPADRFDLLEVLFVLQPDEAGGAELSVRVIDPDGVPVEGVSVTVDERLYGETASGGALSLAGLAPGVRSVALSRPHLRPIAPRDVVVSAGIREELFTAAWDPGAVDVAVRGVDGPAPDARVRFVGDQPMDAVDVGADGHVFTTLPPGPWTVVVSSPVSGIQERDLTVVPDSRSLHRVEFVLAPQEGGLASLALRVVDPEERPVDNAKVSLDGSLRGTSSNLGTLRLQGLDVGTRSLVVWTEPYEPAMRDLKLLEGEHELEVGLTWSVGATRVHVVREGLPLPDAVVRFFGDHPHPPAPVDGEGNALARLEPGLWLVVATSPTGGVAEWDLEVKPVAKLHQVELDMSGAGQSRSDLFVRVVDPYGRPVEHATIWLDGDQKAGETEQGGAVLARDLEPRVVSLRVEAPDFLPTAPVDVQLVPGTVEQVVRLSWPTVPVTVRAVDEHDDPVPAIVQWVGPRDVPPVRSDGAGRAEAELAPGSWRALVRAADGRALAGELSLSIDLGDAPPPRTIVVAPTRAVMAGAEVTLGEAIPFDFGKATLRPDATPILDELARLLVAEDDIVRLEVQGHTDNVGGVAYNQALSQQRADAVVRALVAHGVAIEKLVATGYGPTRPLGDNATDAGRAKNRRVQVVVVERAARAAPGR